MPYLENMNFVSLDLSILPILLNTLITFLIVKKFLYKPVKKMLASREEEVRRMYSDAEEASKQAEASRDEYSAKLASAKEEAGQIVAAATRKAQLGSESILNEAKDKANHIMEKANEQIAAEKKKAVNEIKNDITDIALLAASKVVEKDMDKADHEKLIEGFIDHLE